MTSVFFFGGGGVYRFLYFAYVFRAYFRMLILCSIRVTYRFYSGVRVDSTQHYQSISIKTEI